MRPALPRLRPLVALAGLLAACAHRPAAPADASCQARLAAQRGTEAVIERRSAELPARRVALARDGVHIVLAADELLAGADRWISAHCAGDEAARRRCHADIAGVIAVRDAVRDADPASPEPVVSLPAPTPRFDALDRFVADTLEAARFVIVDGAGTRHTTLLLQRTVDGAGQRLFHLADAECTLFLNVFDWIA